MHDPNQFIVTGDDLGVSPGVNQAIVEAHNEGALTHASLMVGAHYVQDALSLVNTHAPTLQVGVHLNLTGCQAILPQAKIGLLVDKQGKFKHGFLKIFLLTLSPCRKKILEQIQAELEAQINKAMALGVKPSHLDGHHHIHMIPPIFKMVTQLAKKYAIPRVRCVNENLRTTLRVTRTGRSLLTPNAIKWLVLRLFRQRNASAASPYFFSILYSCKIRPSDIVNLSKIKSPCVEIMLHPGNPAIDRTAMLDEKEKKHLLSKYRTLELETARKLKGLLH